MSLAISRSGGYLRGGKRFGGLGGIKGSRTLGTAKRALVKPRGMCVWGGTCMHANVAQEPQLKFLV